MENALPAYDNNGVDKKTLWRVITASSVGTVIEWYDFYIFGSLAVIIGAQYFPKGENPLIQTIEALALFATGFVVRPFGALFFGRLGDLIGRKYTFLVTLMLMGGSTFAIAFVPGYESIGIAAPLILLVLRLLQGLALGGEYGGATTYVAEHAPDKHRGYYTSFIQLTATVGLFLSILVILACRLNMDSESFNSWGWRVPFGLSGILVIFSYFIRKNMHESPLFAKLKAEGNISKNPLKESFTNKENLKMVLLALFGITAGQGCVWYTGQFYAQGFIGNILNVEFVTTNIIVAVAVLLATPFYIVFGGLSDKVGRKKIMMLGLLLAVINYYPIYRKMDSVVDYSHKEIASSSSKTSLTTSPDGKSQIQSVKDEKIFTDGSKVTVTTATAINNSTVTKAQKPEVKTVVEITSQAKYWLIFLVFIQVIFVTMVYGPVAAFLVELFPTKIRYTSMSLPYHIGNGIFGGLTPLIATSVVVATGDKFAGLYYPLAVALITLIIGTLFIKDKRNVKIMEDEENEPELAVNESRRM
ncbi:MAG: MFS transporter [Bacteroidota bacterium]